MSTPSRRKSSGKAKGARASTTTPSAAAGDDGRDGLQLFSSATVATAASATVPPASHVADSHAAPLGDAAEAAGGGDAQAAAEAVGKVLGEVGELAVQATQHVRSRRRIQPTARGVSFLEVRWGTWWGWGGGCREREREILNFFRRAELSAD